MLGERPAAEYGIVIAALGVLLFLVRALLAHWKHVHDTTQKGSGNGDVIMRAHVEDNARQIDKLVGLWGPERAKQMSETHASLLKMETLNIHKDEVMKDLLKESRKTNTLLERFITLNTHQKPWECP